MIRTQTEAGAPLMVYAISMFAWQPITRTVEHRAFCAFDGTEADAHKAGLKEARRLWPPAKGYREHHTQVQPIEIRWSVEPQTIHALPEESQQDFLM